MSLIRIQTFKVVEEGIRFISLVSGIKGILRNIKKIFTYDLIIGQEMWHGTTGRVTEVIEDKALEFKNGKATWVTPDSEDRAVISISEKK